MIKLTLYYLATQMKIKQLSNSDQSIIRSFLEKDPISNLYLLDLIDRQGIDYWGMHRWEGAFNDNEELIAINADIACTRQNHPCKLSVPVGEKTACERLGERTAQRGGCERVMAERDASDAFYKGLGSPKARIYYEEELLLADSHPQESYLQLVPAKKEQLEILIEYTALMRVEDEGFDPRERDLDLWTKTISILIAQERILVHNIYDEIVFVAEVGTRSQIGAQIGSIYVPKKYRRKGLGVRGMRGIVALLLKKSDFLTLLVHKENKPAYNCHIKAGWKYHADFRVIEMDIF